MNIELHFALYRSMQLVYTKYLDMGLMIPKKKKKKKKKNNPNVLTVTTEPNRKGGGM